MGDEQYVTDPRRMRQRLRLLPASLVRRLLEAIRKLGDDPRPHGCQQLTLQRTGAFG